MAGTRPARAGRIERQPALDGIRALAVLAVLLFHAGVPGLDGGYLGVSVFFTLSGFLITLLMIGERTHTGRVSTSAFYARRVRRLLPASAACLAAIAVLAAAGAWDQVPHLRRDLAGAALQVFNWVRLAGSGSYADLFSQTGGQLSPLEHYWSLAIEEQFYWVWPLAFTGLAALAAHGSRSLVRVLAVPTLVAIAAGPVIAAIWGPDAAYWATPARVGEILTGALAAAVVAGRGSPRWTAAAAPFGLVAIGVACVAFPTAGGPAYAGWLPALSVVTAVVLLGLQHDSRLRRTLSWRPLVALGTISYGVYLYHWPLFTLLDEQRLGRGGWSLVAVRLAATAAIAAISYVALERPVRRARWRPRPTLVAGAGLTAAAVALIAIVPPAATSIDTAGEAAATAAIDPAGATTPLSTSAGRDAGAGLRAERFRRLDLVAPTPNRPVRILVIGDSTAKATGGGLARWAADHPDLAQVTLAAAFGCGFVQGGTRVFPQGDRAIAPSCATYLNGEVVPQVRALHPDVVVAMTTTWDVIDQRFPGTGVEAPTDDEYGRRIRRDLGDATRRVLDAGAPQVLWIAEPTVDPYWNPLHSPQEEPERHAVLHDAMEALRAADPDRVAVADLAWWIGAAGLADDHATRPDGVHLSTEAAVGMAGRWLGPASVITALRG